MSSLYEISSNYRQAILEMADMDDLPGDVLDDTLEGMEGEFNDKAIAVTSFFKNLEAESKAIKEAEAAMKARRTILDKKIARLKAYLLENMQQTGITKISCPYFQVSVRNNAPSVVVTDETLIPEQFRQREIVEKIDKKAIKDAGGCPGAELVRGKSLSIK